MDDTPPVPAPLLPVSRNFLYNDPGRREVHAVATIQDALSLAAKFRKEGRDLTYRGITPNPNPSSKKDPLRWIAVFDGPDAGDFTFEDYRYNSEQEYSVDDLESLSDDEVLPSSASSSDTHPQLPSPRTRYSGNEKQRHFRRSRSKDWSGW